MPVSASRSPSGGTAPRKPADRLGALGARVLAVVGLVDDERARAPAGERLAVGGDDLVVEDRDVAARRDRAAPLDDRHRTVRQPLARLTLPAELHRRRAHHDRRISAVGLERGERLDGLAEPLLVGQERPARVEHVAHAGPLKRRQLAAERRRDRLDRLGVVSARAAHRVRGGAALVQQPLEHLAGRLGDLDVVAAR